MALRPDKPERREGQETAPDVAGTLEVPEDGLVELRKRARTLAEAVPATLRLDFARTFCAEVVRRYWGRLPSPPRRNLRPVPPTRDRLKAYQLDLAVALGDVAATKNADEASYGIGRVYAMMLPDDFRSQNGVYYTPPTVVTRLLDAVAEAGMDWSTGTVLDPACGGGAFVGPTLRRIVPGLRKSDRRFLLSQLRRRVHGLELDPFSAWMSKVFIDVTLFEELEIVADDDFSLVEVANSLQHVSDGYYDLVIGNPPYGKVKLDATDRQKFERSLFGHANLYGLFLDLAVRVAKQNGLIAYVTPTGFLCGEYFKKLRSLLMAEAEPVGIEFISERSGVFDDVLQETLLAVFRRGRNDRQPRIRFVEVQGARINVADAGSVSLPSAGEQPWIVARAPESASLAARMRAMPSRLSDWGYGVSTGPLVWNRYKERLRERPLKATVPLIWAEAVSADGKFSFRAARRNHAPYFAVEPGDDALLVRRPCVLLQRTTSKEQARRLVAAELPPAFLDEHGAITVENHLNMIVPIIETPLVGTSVLAAFLNSNIADRAFRCISGTVAVSAYELESMPLPPAWAMKSVAEILDAPHGRNDIDRVCARLYGEK